MTNKLFHSSLALISLFFMTSCALAALDEVDDSPEKINRPKLDENSKPVIADELKVKIITQQESVYAKMTSLAGGVSCKTDAHCASMPVGNATCGGPASYMVYSSLIGDEAVTELSALATQTKELDIEMAKLNQANGRSVLGICRYNTPSDVACIENVCKAVANELIR